MTTRPKRKNIKTKDEFQNILTRSGWGQMNPIEMTDYPLTRLTRNWQIINALYRSHWVVRRIIDVIPADMLKNGYKIITQVPPGQIALINKMERQTRLYKSILEGLRWGRLYGGAGGLIMIDGDEDRLNEPIDYDLIMPDSFKGLLIADRWTGISPNADIVSDPSDPDFGEPMSYMFTAEGVERGIEVHHSRIIRFIGRELPYLEKLAENYWGASEIEHTFTELRKRDNVSYNMAMLTFMANLRCMKIDGLDGILGGSNLKSRERMENVVEALNIMMNNNSLQVLGTKDSFETHPYTFSGLGEMYDRFMMDVAGAAEMPVTKLFGRSPAGMNATGESDMQNYYDTIEEKQESYLRPVYDKLIPIMMMSCWGAIPDDFDYQFNPVRRMTDDKMADLGSKNTDSITKVYDSGIISQKTALRELRQQSDLTGLWSNITDEDIENADNVAHDPSEGINLPLGGEPDDTTGGTVGDKETD